MKNITEPVTFAENPFSLVVKTVIFGIAGFTLAAIILSIFSLPPDNKGNEITGKFLFAIMGIEILLFLTLFLIRSFTRKRTVTCDSNSCDIYATNFWNSFYESDSFLWSEATDTNITEEYIEAKTIFIDVEVKGKTKRLLSRNLSSQRTFSELIEFINQATPHLNYVWEKNSNFGNRQVIVEVGRFSKVARL